MTEQTMIGIFGISPGSLVMARRIADLGRSVAMCGLPGAGKDDGEESARAAGLRVLAGLTELKSELGPNARIFSFLRYGGYLEAAASLLKTLEPGDAVFESNAFPYAALEKTESEHEMAGVGWIPIKVAICAEDGREGISIVACGKGLDGQGRSLLSSIATDRLDGKPCYAEFPDARRFAAARASYRGLMDVMFQGFADAYRVISGLLGMSPFEARMAFAEWSKSELDSPVLHGMRDILGTMDESGAAALDMILDTVKLDSGDLDSITLSLSFGMPPPLSSAAFAARAVSALRDERLGASVALSGAKSVMPLGKEFISELRDALIAAFALAVSQSFDYLQKSSGLGEGGNVAQAVAAWAGASLLQGPLLDKAAVILAAQDSPRSLLLEPEFQRIMNRCQAGLRKTVAAIVEAGIPAPVLSSALSLYDSFRSEKLSSNFVAAGLDYFFGIGFERVDRPRSERYRRDWRGDGSMERLS
jgi:6-phosphogluconate dehydrogenase